MPLAFELQNLIKDANTKVTSSENKERKKLLNTPPIIVTDERNQLERQSSSATTVEEGDVAKQSNFSTNSEVCTALYGNYEFW